MNQHNAHPEQDSSPAEERLFTRMGDAARSAVPDYCPDLHARIMQRIEEERAQKALAAAAQSEHPATAGIRFSQIAALAAAVSLLLVAAWLWSGLETEPPSMHMAASHPRVTTPAGNRLEVIGPVVDSPGAALAQQPKASPGHEDISNAINYLLSLGNTKPAAVPRQPRPTPDANTPWLRPTVSDDVLAFELDQRRLEQLADTLFAMQ